MTCQTPPDLEAQWRRLRAQDTASLDELREMLTSLWHAYRRHIFVVAWNALKDADAAETVVTQTFSRAWRWYVKNQHCLPEQVHFHAWLTRIASRLIIDQIRRDAAGPNIISEADARTPAADSSADHLLARLGADTDPPISRIVKAETLRRLGDCVDHLPSHLNAVIVDYYITGRDQKDIALQMDVHEGTIGRRRRIALQALRDCLQQPHAHALTMVHHDA